jgi:hypothetical protein
VLGRALSRTLGLDREPVALFTAEAFHTCLDYRPIGPSRMLNELSGALRKRAFGLPSLTGHGFWRLAAWADNSTPAARVAPHSWVATHTPTPSVGLWRQSAACWFRPIMCSVLVPLAGIEPALLAESDFESDASTSSAIGARAEADGADIKRGMA